MFRFQKEAMPCRPRRRWTFTASATATRKSPYPEKKTVIVRPLWIVGVSPFDPVIAHDSGHVVHLGEPRFTARWTMNAETMARISQPDFRDEELGIVLCEALSADGPDPPPDAWLIEAACAVAYAKGLIAAIEPEEMH